MLRKKYRKEREELLSDLESKSIHTKVLDIELKALSKVKDHFLYECVVLDHCKRCNTSIGKTRAICEFKYPRRNIKSDAG